MRWRVRDIMQQVTPPIVSRGVKAAFFRHPAGSRQREDEGEKGPEWYDAAFEQTEHRRGIIPSPRITFCGT